MNEHLGMCATYPKLAWERQEDAIARNSEPAFKILFDSACPLWPNTRACTCTTPPCIATDHPFGVGGFVQSRRDLLAGASRIAVAGALPALALPVAAYESSSQEICFAQEISFAGEWL